jgi:hypothetical protein
MRKPKQLALFVPRPRRPRKAKLYRPEKGSQQCQNLLRRRQLIDGHYRSLGNEQCAHRGRLYDLHGYQMVLCVCCARRLTERTNICPKEIKDGGPVAQSASLGGPDGHQPVPLACVN